MRSLREKDYQDLVKYLSDARESAKMETISLSEEEEY